MTRVAMAGPNRLSARAADRLADEGGNAADVAVGAMLVATTTEPAIVSLAGGGFATVRPPDRAPRTYDGYVAAPGLGQPPEGGVEPGFEITTEYAGGVTFAIGHGSVAVPGTPQLLARVHAEHGRMPWAQVLAPAIEIAATGFPLGSASDHYLSLVHETVYGWHEPSHAALHHPDGRRIIAGEHVVVAGLADSLRQLADEGVDAFVAGELAAAIVGDVAAHRGALSLEDLAAYEVVARRPLEVELGALRLATNPPPALGGAVLAAMALAVRGRLDAADGRLTPASVRRIVETQRAVLTHRVERLDLADDRAVEAAGLVAAVAAAGLLGLSSPSTVQVSTVDADGLAVAMTASAGYGSGAMPPGTGIWLNNALGEQELARRGADGYPPGSRLPSNMAPSVAWASDGRLLALGTPGADRIVSALLWTFAGLDTGLDLAAAVAHPRAHVTVRPDRSVRLDHEEDLMPDEDVLPGVHRHVFAPSSMEFGAVAAVERGGDGALGAVADARRDGGTAVR